MTKIRISQIQVLPLLCPFTKTSFTLMVPNSKHTSEMRRSHMHKRVSQRLCIILVNMRAISMHEKRHDVCL